MEEDLSYEKMVLTAKKGEKAKEVKTDRHIKESKAYF